MKGSAVTDAASATPMGDALASKERPEVAAVLLQRLNHALDAGDKARTARSRSMPAVQADGQLRVNSEPPDDTSTRVPNEHAFGSLTFPATSYTTHSAAMATANEPATPPAIADELLNLLERLCSGVYVGDRSSVQQRVLLTLEGALPGAAAEIVRDGAHLTIRLHASNETAYRIMLKQRDALGRTLNEHGLPQVAIEVMSVGGLVDARRE